MVSIKTAVKFYKKFVFYFWVITFINKTCNVCLLLPLN